MTRKSIERRLERIEDVEDTGEGFYHFEITSKSEDSHTSGHYSWESSVGAYTNDKGHAIPPEDAPEADFEYNIEYEDGN